MDGCGQDRTLDMVAGCPGTDVERTVRGRCCRDSQVYRGSTELVIAKGTQAKFDSGDSLIPLEARHM